MHIVTSVLEKYCIKNGSAIYVSFDTVDNRPTLAFTLGKYEQFGSIRVFLNNKEIEEILELNNIIGEGSAVDKLLKGKSREPDSEIEKFIYDVLSKYVLQMLFASRAEILFPEITPLQKHRRDYFRNDVLQN